jgi:hypothetical protein
MFLAEILSKPMKFIDSFEDLANAEDVMLVARAGSSSQIRFRVSIMIKNYRRRLNCNLTYNIIGFKGLKYETHL